MHSGCVLSDGSVYQWGTCGDYSKIKDAPNSKELLLKCVCQYPVKVSFRGLRELVVQSTGQRKRSTTDMDQGNDVYSAPQIKDIRMGE